MIKEILKEYKNLLIDNKKFILLYVFILSILTIAMLSPRNIANPKTEIISFIFIILLGSFLLLYSFNNKNSLNNVAIVFIIIFGIILTILIPSFSIPDEIYHFSRVEHILNGILFPIDSNILVNSYYYVFKEHMFDLYMHHRNPGIVKLLINNSQAYSPISSSSRMRIIHVPTTPFYSYIFSAIGIFIAKFLDLGVIFAVWLSRIPNLIFYAIMAYFGIKKAPVYKMPILLFACTPILLPLISSTNYDSFMAACFILAFGYFVYMCKNKAKNRDVVIFLICCLLIGGIKPPYFIVVLLIFFIPKENLPYKRPILTLLCSIIILALVIFFMIKGMTFFHNTPTAISQKSSVSITGQINYILTHPIMIFNILWQALYFFIDKIIINTIYYHSSWVGLFKGVKLYNISYFIFSIIFSILYPIKLKFSRNKRIALIFFVLLFYFGMFFCIYLVWSSVGSSKVWGMQVRYFIYLLVLLPLIINYPFKKIKNSENYALTGIMIFMAGFFMLTITHFC